MTTRRFHRLSLPQGVWRGSDGHWRTACCGRRHRKVVNNS
ncbi:hypothetical protein AZ78_2532 [Lysobacter capsici AZ78]|uniref:Uncharacterized protein n=1 Tax=Lysobacter capsici AZ78 TaxID=1444315 RepID=A0A108U9E4_9GAMM|nr:hypothetical protein AZ78_2532 [Lysobacter capsici AZ78]